MDLTLFLQDEDSFAPTLVKISKIIANIDYPITNDYSV